MSIVENCKKSFECIFGDENLLAKNIVFNHTNIFKSNSIKVQILTYLPSMATHALSIPINLILSIIYFTTALFLSVASIITLRRFEKLNEWCESSWLLCIHNLATISVDVVGTLCPPIASKLNELFIEIFDLDDDED